MAEFSALLRNFLVENNEERNRAEGQYNQLTVAEKMTHLVNAVRNHQDVEIRAMAAVLLRRLCVHSEELLNLGQSVLEPCKTELLAALQNEPVATVRRKICETVAEMARACIDEAGTNHWPMILKFLFECCNPQSPQLYEAALNIIGSVPGVFADQQGHYIVVIKQMLQQALNHPQEKVWTAAFKATSSFLVFQDEDDKTRSYFTDLLPILIKLLRTNLEAGEDSTVLQSMVDICTECPKFVRGQFDHLVELCLTFADNEMVEESIRQLTMEVIISLAENAPSMFRKHGSKFIQRFILQCVKFMIDLEDDPQWSLKDEMEEEDPKSNVVVGEGLIDRLSIAIGGRVLLQPIMATAPSLLQSADWRLRHSGLMMLGAMAEGCYDQMFTILDQIVLLVVPYCQDPHCRVRFAACNALGQFSIDFPLHFQKKYHTKVVPSLLMVLNDIENPQVQSHAAAALVNFIEQCPKAVLAKYIDDIVFKLEDIFSMKLKELLEKGTKQVLGQVITTTATVAEAMGDQFAQYYNRFMPSLKYIVANVTKKEYRLLRGKTIECISLIGLAVGAEKFMHDAADVMKLLLKLQTEQDIHMEVDDPQISYMMSAWGRMCKILGQSFVEYLPVVMEPLLKIASHQPEFTFVDSVDAEEAYNKDGGWEFITLADHQRLGVRTFGLDDKFTACQMLVVYARDLKGGFVDYVEPVAKIMIPLLRFLFHDMIRIVAAEILPYLLEDIQGKGIQAVQEMWSTISEKLLEAMNLEFDSDIWAVMADSLCSCIEMLGANCFTIGQYNTLVTIFKVRLQTSFLRVKDRMEKRKEEDYDEELEEDLNEEDKIDEQYLKKIADIMHALFKTHKTHILPFFNELVPVFSSMLDDSKPSFFRQWSLCTFDDLIECCGQHAATYQQYFLQPMLKCICDKAPQVRQAAVFGIGVMAQYASEQFAHACLEAIPLLTVVISDPNSRSNFLSIHATENAISAVAKICKYLKNGVPYETVLPTWLSWLPVVEDKDEAVHVYGYLCDLIESQSPFILGHDNQNVPRILAIFATALKEDTLSGNSEVHSRVLTILRHINSSQEVWNACMRFLSDDNKHTLDSALGLG